MIRQGKWIAVLVVSLFVMAGVAKAQDVEKSLKSNVSVGYHFIGHDDEMTKVGEYESLSSGAHANVDIDAVVGQFAFGGHGYYYGQDEKDWSGYLDMGRVIRMDYAYDSFLHRLQHDNLYKDEPRFPKNITGNGVNNGLIAFNPFWRTDPDLHVGGAQMATAEDLDTGKDYQIMRSTQKATFKMQLPFFPYIVPEVRLKQENKRGWRQATFMSGKCTPCHIVGNGRRVNEHTREVTAGLTAKYGIVTASYFHTWRHFDNDASTPQTTFDKVFAPEEEMTFFPQRLMYDGETGGYAEVPDVHKGTDKFKVRVDLPYHTTAYGSYVSSNVENDYTNKDYGIDAYAGRITTTMLNNALTVTLKGRYYTIDNDDVHVDIGSMSNDPTVTGPGYGVPPSYVNYDRKSDLDRDVTELGANFRYKLAKHYTLRAGYEYTRISRDNKDWKDYDNPDLEDDQFLDDEDTSIHRVKLSLLGRPINNVNFRLTYKYEHQNDEFENHNGICFEHRDLPKPGGVPYYEIFRNQYRHRDASNVPQDTHDIKLVTTWSPSGRYSATLNLQYKYQDNDDSDWEGETYVAGINFWLSPVNNLYVNLGASYEYNTYETRFDLNLFGG
jgi:hypothetical protein